MRTLLARASAQPSATVILLAVAAAARLGYFAYADIVRGADSALYLRIAASFADGDPQTFGFPVHVLYGITLVPIELFGIGVSAWVIVLHTALGLATVLFVHRTALLFAGPAGSLFAGLAAALLPTALFWSHYVLTETLFTALAAGFMFACGRALADPAARFALAGPPAAGLLVVISRPVGVFVAGVGLAFVLWALVAERSGPQRARRTVTIAVAAGLVLVLAVLAVPTTRDKLMSNQTVAVSLWNSTRIWNSDFDHVGRGVTLPADLRGLSTADRVEEQKDRAIDYIENEPVEYAGHAVIRFGSFWLPAASATWGPAHKLYDFGLMILLLGSLAFALLRPPQGRGRRVVVLCASLALVQGVLVMFSQIDSEARYRLPAEVVLLPLVAAPFSRVFDE